MEFTRVCHGFISITKTASSTWPEHNQIHHFALLNLPCADMERSFANCYRFPFLPPLVLFIPSPSRPPSLRIPSRPPPALPHTRPRPPARHDLRCLACASCLCRVFASLTPPAPSQGPHGLHTPDTLRWPALSSLCKPETPSNQGPLHHQQRSSRLHVSCPGATKLLTTHPSLALSTSTRSTASGS